MKGLDCAMPLTAKTANKLAAEGFIFACRYLVPERYAWKRLTKAEAEAISKAGMQVVSVFETTANRASGGMAAGQVDGREALKEAKLIDQPLGSAIYFAVDYNAPPADYDAIERYLRAASKEIEGYGVGIYGSYAVVKEMLNRGVCKHLWQTYAWSAGQFTSQANIHQYQNGKTVCGVSLDLNESYGGEGWWNTLPLPEKEEESDVSSWAKDAQAWVIKNGISDGTRPKDGVTREEMFTMLHRYSKKEEK